MTSSMEVSQSHCWEDSLFEMRQGNIKMAAAYPVNVEDVDVTGAELLEGSLHGNMKRLHMVPNVR